MIIFAGSDKHMNKIPLITIAICTYNRADYLRDTLEDLKVQLADPGDFEVLVINNRSTDHTADVCREITDQNSGMNFKWVNEPQQGLSFARNRALKEAQSNVILYIDDDVHLPDGFVGSALCYMKKYPNVECAGGRIFVSFEENNTGWIPHELMPMFGLHDLGDSDRIYPPANFPRGGNMLIKKNLFEAFGTFNTELGRIGSELLGSEEKEFFERIRKDGVKLQYWSDLKLWHRIGAVRLMESYLKKQSVGIGRSERLRTGGSAGRVLKKLISEALKMFGSLFLSIAYLIRGRVRAAGFLLKFRVWVLRGFLFGN